MAGLKTLLLLVLRRDRIKLPVAIVLTVVSLVVMVPLLSDVYGDKASLAAVIGWPTDRRRDGSRFCSQMARPTRLEPMTSDS